VLMAIPSAGIPVSLQYLAASPPLQSTAYLSTLYSLFWVGPYIILCLGAIKELLNERGRSPFQIAFVLTGMIVFLCLFADSFLSGADGVMWWLPYIMLGLVTLGYIIFNINEALASKSVTER
jgi:basic amino acid/polyamine antiporter, APA family